MSKFRKKPVVIEAWEWDQSEASLEYLIDIQKVPFDRVKISGKGIVKFLSIKTLEGRHVVSNGDWIIKGIKGEFYPCKPDIFEATYEQIDEKPV